MKNIEDIKPPKKEPSTFFLELSKAKAEAIGKRPIDKTASRSSRRKSSGDIVPPEPQPLTSDDYGEKASKHEPPRKVLWIIAGISVAALLFSLPLAFSGVSVTFTPKTASFEMNSDLSAERGSVSNLSFETVSLDGEEIVEVKKSGQTSDASKARGTVIIYNNYGKSPQNLLINTRLSDPKGKIYFTDKAVTVPGQTVKNGVTSPGSVEVGVTAEKPGEEYNGDPTDFTIVGFKGTPKYDKFYGRSKTPLSGGSSTPQNTITEEEAARAYEEAKGKLREKLVGRARAETPEGFILFDDTVFFSTVPEIPQTHSLGETIPVSAHGSIQAFLFDEKKLGKTILEDALGGYDGSPAEITNLSELSFTLKNKQLINPETSRTISFTISGTVSAVWDVDEEALKDALAGKKKRGFDSILEGFPSIDKAHVVVTPFWKSSFPEDIDKIKVINDIEAAQNG